MSLFFDDAICEEVVGGALRERALGGDARLHKAFRNGADAIYRTVTLRKRQVAFFALYQKTFRLLGHPERIEALLQEMEGEGRLPAQTYFMRVFGAEEEEARLSPDRARLGVRIRTETFTDAARCAYFLRHEILHILDLLDPAFGCGPGARLSADSPAEETLYRDRYRTLWDLSVDGRLERECKLPGDVRTLRAAEFHALFPGLGTEEAERVFEALWSGPRPAHADLGRMVEGAAALCAALGVPPPGGPENGTGGAPGTPCPLCRFTTFEWAEPEGALAEAVRKEYPGWAPSQGLCTQCANRYLLGAGFSLIPVESKRE
ncbi:MAG: hypothetical protein V3V56_02035 [bacterium]